VKSVWPLVWSVVAVIILGEAGFLWWSGRFPALIPHAVEIPRATDIAHATETPPPKAPAAALPGLPELPVHVLTPPTRGEVLPQLQNASAQTRTLRVTVRRPGTDRKKAWVIALGPNQTLSIARRDGWAFAFGDELELVQDGYRTRKVLLQ
jgi:hypothetical protein